MPSTTEKAKNAFNPIAGAKPNGKLATKPIRKQPTAAPKQVAVTKAPASMPVSDKMLGLTAMMYAMVRNVVRPAKSSVFMLTFC